MKRLFFNEDGVCLFKHVKPLLKKMRQSVVQVTTVVKFALTEGDLFVGRRVASFFQIDTRGTFAEVHAVIVKRPPRQPQVNNSGVNGQ